MLSRQVLHGLSHLLGS
jgi:hypothetical protein